MTREEKHLIRMVPVSGIRVQSWSRQGQTVYHINGSGILTLVAGWIVMPGVNGSQPEDPI